MLPHTDGSFDEVAPTDVLLQCVSPDSLGYGASVVVNGRAALAELPASHRRELASEGFLFRRDERGMRSAVCKPVVAHANGPCIRYREDDKYSIGTASEPGSASLAEFRRVVRSDRHRCELRLEAGDILWLDNRIVLHGRTALSGDRVRRLRRLRLVR